MSDALEATPEEMAEYRATARRRWDRERPELVQREERAWEVVRRAAMLLRGQFGATRMVVFGSLVRQGCFTRWSDVDITVWGIYPEKTFLAIYAVAHIDEEIEVDLVDVKVCRPSLLTAIELEGIEL